MGAKEKENNAMLLLHRGTFHVTVLFLSFPQPTRRMGKNKKISIVSHDETYNIFRITSSTNTVIILV